MGTIKKGLMEVRRYERVAYKKHKESVELIVSAKDAYRIVTARREMTDETY